MSPGLRCWLRNNADDNAEVGLSKIDIQRAWRDGRYKQGAMRV